MDVLELVANTYFSALDLQKLRENAYFACKDIMYSRTLSWKEIARAHTLLLNLNP